MVIHEFWSISIYMWLLVLEGLLKPTAAREHVE